MSNSGRIFLGEGGANDDNGSGVNLELSFTSEQDLDDKLWLDPELAADDLRFLLKVHQGELSPTLSRLALKAMTLPLFKREFYGEETSLEIEEEIQTIPKRNARLLDAYIQRVGDTTIDQVMLKQAIDDTTVLQLMKNTDIILLPAGPEEDHNDRPTSFTVLRRQQLGRALLYISEVRPAVHIHAPQANGHRIQIRPTGLLSDGANRYDLAEALIAEQQGDITSSDLDLITTAQTRVHDTINAHFDRIQPQS